MADENELTLDLSIGGIFAKPKPSVTESVEKDNGIEGLNPQSNDGVRAIRRRKREEKLKKSVDYGSCGSVSGPFVENKETQIVVQNDELARKKEKIGDMTETFGSVLTAPVDDDMDNVFGPTAKSFKPYQGNMNLKPCCKLKSNGCGSSAYSDGQCSSHQGCASDDSRSNSSNSQVDHQPASTSTASVEPSDQHQPTGSSKQTVSTNLTNSAVSNPHDESSVLTPPSKPEPSSQQQASLLARMPCVSTTGNGPNGKTVSGFLYRYTKKEVSIVCVCHGRSFSPAGFVEHAGGVDITHPLKHITIYPAAFAS